ncbi:MAG: hypothetical protein MUE67_08085 [Anaerolineales bacterium]|jgi:hypothetical protein|nr:hypothetical protein [Anaerolineales bacterium]
MTDSLPDWLQEEEKRRQQQTDPVVSAQSASSSGISEPGEPGLYPDTQDFLSPIASGLETLLPVGRPEPILQISEMDQKRAGLFGKIAAGTVLETQPGQWKVSTSQPLLRLLITGILLTALLGPLVLSQNRMVFAPPEVSSDTLVAFKTVQGLPPGAAVLLAVDYQAGYSAELTWAALPLVQQLVDQGARLALVSSLPAGPAQAEILIQQVSFPTPQPALTPSVINYGFIPGGKAGLRNFLENPAKVFRIAGQPVIALGEFALVVIASDQADVVRDWLEQIRPRISETPFILVLSEQAAPPLQPYLRAVPAPLQGAVIGLRDGMAYGQLTNRLLVQAGVWASFNQGLLAAILLIALAGAANGLLSVWRSSIIRKSQEGSS